MASMNQKLKVQEHKDKEIVKCACGLTMRQKNWRDHWYTCRVGSSVPVAEQDKENLLAEEKRRNNS